MKIILIGQKGIPAIYGGVERHVEELAVRLVQEGHDVSAYTRLNYSDKNLTEYKGVKLISLTSIKSKYLDAISHTFLACLNIIFKQKADVVHFHSIGPSSLLWLIKIFKPRVKVVATFHSQCYFHQKWNFIARGYLKLGEYICCNWADETIVVSKNLKKYAKNKYNQDLIYIPNGVPEYQKVEVDIIKKWNLEKENYILSVSRLIPHKGIHYLIKAYNQIETYKKLVITGDASFTDEYYLELQALSCNNPNIIFTGNQDGRALAELFSNAYLFVQPSESEGLSIALLESMSYGNAVLSSDIPENREVVGDDGLLFENKNIEDLKNKLNLLLSQPDTVKNNALKNIEIAKRNYSWNIIVADVTRVYNDILTSANNTERNLVKKFVNYIF